MSQIVYFHFEHVFPLNVLLALNIKPRVPSKQKQLMYPGVARDFNSMLPERTN